MKYCFNCGSQLNDDDMVCAACNSQQIEEQPETVKKTAEPKITSEIIFQAPPKKKNKKWLLVLIIVIAVLGLTTLIGALTNWFGLYTPIDKLALAFKKTITADSFSVKITADDENTKIKVVVDKDNEDFTVLANDDRYETLYYNGTVYEKDGSYSHMYEVDQKEIYETYEDATNFDDIPWEDLVDKADLNEQLDADNLQDFCTSLYKDYLNDSDWLEETMCYELDGDVYTFEPNIEDAAEDILDLVRDKEIIKSKYEDEIDEFEDDLEYLIEDIDDLKIEITLDRKYISEIKFKIKSDGETYDIKIEFFDINETEISKDKIDDIIDEVKEEIENDKCPDCGERRWGSSDCWRCSCLCYECYEFYKDYEMMDSLYCRYCASYCDGCYQVKLNENLYSYGSNEYCYSCYLDEYYYDYSWYY